jgi:D-galactarolactone cycloisomerase
MPVFITSIKAFPLTARFEQIYGSAGNVPDEILRPASHFQSIPRVGQFSSFVVCEASDGSVGFGECFGLPTPEPAAELVNRVIAPAIKGQELAHPEQLMANVKRFFHALGHSRGPAMEALSGVDIALWDLIARRNGLSLAEELGGTIRPLPLYVSPIPLLATPDLTAKATATRAEGYGAVKLKIGRSAGGDAEHVAAASEALPPGVDLMLDANCAFDLGQARQFVRDIDGLNVRWLEEPLPPEETAGLQALSDSSRIPLAGGENEFLPQSIERLVHDAGLRIVQPNISRIGGVSGLRELDRLLCGTGARIAPHGVGGCVTVAATLHAVCSLRHFEIFELNTLPNPLRDALGVQPSLTPDGLMMPPPGPGHGSPLNTDLAQSDFAPAR